MANRIANRIKLETQAGSTYTHWLNRPALIIGKTVFSRRELVEKLRCGHFAAASRLSAAIQKFKPRDAIDLSKRMDVESLASVKGVGVVTLFVWTCVMDYYELPWEDWLSSTTKLATIIKHARNGEKGEK